MMMEEAQQDKRTEYCLWNLGILEAIMNLPAVESALFSFLVGDNSCESSSLYTPL